MSIIDTMLRGTGLFDGLAETAFRNLVAGAEPLTVEPGRTILHEGDVGDAVYVVRLGAVQIFTQVDDGSIAPGQLRVRVGRRRRSAARRG